MDTNSFGYDIESEDFHKDIVEDVEPKFNIIEYSKDNNRPLLIGKDENVICMMKNKFGAKIIIEIINFRANIYLYVKLEIT